jgi:hypothetical protein
MLVTLAIMTMLPVTAAYAKTRAVLPPMVFGYHKVTVEQLNALIAANK